MRPTKVIRTSYEGTYVISTVVDDREFYESRIFNATMDDVLPKRLRDVIESKAWKQSSEEESWATEDFQGVETFNRTDALSVHEILENLATIYG